MELRNKKDKLDNILSITKDLIEEGDISGILRIVNDLRHDILEYQKYVQKLESQNALNNARKLKDKGQDK